jgi:UDP-N-acetyl-2-amino-2-deoxyglucuronate dehydrogenase
MFYLSVFADEIASDLDQQIKAMLAERVYHLDLRSVGGKNVLDLEARELFTIRETLRDRGVRVAAIGSPIGKIPITEAFAPHFDRFKRAVEIAEELGVSLIRLFSFYIPEGENPADHRDEVLRRFGRFVKHIEEKDLTLGLENDLGLYADTPERCLDLLKSFDSDQLRLTFDTSNFVLAGADPVKDAYPMLKDRIVSLHVKDARAKQRRVVPAGEGDGRWVELAQALKADGFRGFATLEPHLFRKDQHKEEDRVRLFRKAVQAFREVADTAGVPHRTINFGIVGLGVSGQQHKRAIDALPMARVAAICDPALKEERIDGSAVYGDVDQMLKDPIIDAVTVAIPSGRHGEIAIKAAEAGKHILVEKPLEVTLPQIDATMAAVKKAGVRCGKVSQYRFTEGMQALKSAVSKGELGKVVLGDAYIKWYRPQDYYDSGGWRGTRELDGGGALMNQGIHYVDQLLWIMGDVESVQAQTGTLAHERIEVEDVACAVLRFKSGAIGVIEATTSAYPGAPARLEIHGTRGTMVMEGERIVFRGVLGEEEVRATGEAEISSGGRRVEDINMDLVVAQLADFCEAVLYDREPAVTMEEGRLATATVLAIYESSKTGKLIRLDDFARPARA